ncbi:DUF6266 family protein [Parapedobacter koreensis]|uniref:Uncharacterized protein n=1 Tax=Parapedobacter koreensis TaxID=332977 RepID=A0A1H7MEI4_9SPHI|nr:DUF6266 family protein [Parapedobacter koreensis]SEL09613.1 hypothetical protein SAMN05421740_103484 [Parapedobacter koreensis]
MAKFINGAIGTFSGKVGSIIGSSWRSVPYMRGLSKKRTKPFTEAQLAQQQRFGLMGQFLLPLKGLLEIGLANLDDSTATLFNQAMALNLPAVTGTYPDFGIDYAGIQFSKGGLEPLRGVTITHEGETATVSWNPVANRFSGNGDDEVYVLLYDRELNLFYTSDEIAARSAGQADIPLDADTAGHMADTWLFAVARDGSRVSNTVYGGSLMLG